MAMAAIAVALVVASGIHLFGNVSGRSELFDAKDAGIAEAIIAVVLAAGVVGMRRARHHARTIGLATVGFAVAGFFVGLSITARAGHLPDILFHVMILPLLIASFVALLRSR
jgi:hypothetical protein